VSSTASVGTMTPSGADAVSFDNLMKFMLHMTVRSSSELHVAPIADKDVYVQIRSHRDTEV
jgi:hypothetical protein